MSDYSKSTNFTAKDTLPTGNSGKIVKGTELDTEFVAIASAISSKADVSSPALLGTPTAPTATTGTNTTQIASTAYVKQEIATLGNMSLQAKSAVDITGGTVNGVTITSLAADLIVADGGTGRSTLTDKAVLIGAGTGAINSVSPGTSGNVLKSDGTNWTSSSLRGLGLGGETWNDVSASRSLNTTYTNSNSYPIMVSTSQANTTGNNQGYVGSLVVTQGFSGSAANCTLTWIVPPGATYKLAGSVPIVLWTELY